VVLSSRNRNTEKNGLFPEFGIGISPVRKPYFLGPFSRFAQGKEKAKPGGKKGPFELPS